MASEWPRAQKKLQILKAQAFSFPMIYIMSGYEKIDFMTFFDVRALKWLQNGPEPQKITLIKACVFLCTISLPCYACPIIFYVP